MTFLFTLLFSWLAFKLTSKPSSLHFSPLYCGHGSSSITVFAMKAFKYPYCQLLSLNWKYFFIVHLINLHLNLVWEVASSLPLQRILIRLATVNPSRLSNRCSERTRKAKWCPQAGWQTHAGWSAHWTREEAEQGERTHNVLPLPHHWSHLKCVKRQTPSDYIPKLCHCLWKWQSSLPWGRLGIYFQKTVLSKYEIKWFPIF